jgi:hypothetical protein
MAIFLETERMILKPTQLSDFDNILFLRSDPNVMKYIGDGTIHTEEKVKRFLSMAIPYYENMILDFVQYLKRIAELLLVKQACFMLDTMMTRQTLRLPID